MIPNASSDVGSDPSSNNVMARSVDGNRHRPSPINSAPCTRWTCKRTAYIGPKTADNDTIHRAASINGITTSGDDLAAASDPASLAPTSKAKRSGMTNADAATRIAATVCQRVMRATACSALGDNSHGCHGSLHTVSAAANTPKGTNRMRNAMASVRINRAYAMLMPIAP